MDKQKVLDEARTQHQSNVQAIQRRGKHDRIISRLHYWAVLETQGFTLGNGDRAEIKSLVTDLEIVRANMIAADQPPGQDALLTCLGLS